MKTPGTDSGTGRGVLRGLLIVSVAAGLSGCGVFSWIGSRFSSDKTDSAPAPTAKTAAPLGAADSPDAAPRDEPLHPTANKWYGANGRLYRPITDEREFKERGKASVIGADQEGKATASGESYSPRGMTAAHSRLPIPSYARVTDLRTGKTAIVRVNDRGAYERDEAIAISPAAAQKIGLAGNDEVEVERITPAEIAAMPATRTAAPAPAPAPVPVAAPVLPAAVASPQSTPKPAEPTALPPQASASPPPAAEPAAATPAAAPAATAPAAAPAPTAPAAAATAPTRAAPIATAPRTAARAPGAQSTPTGRWSVQVAAFVTDSMAESTRARVAQQLAQGAPNVAATPRVERYGNRWYVLLGDFADRDSAEALAGRLRAVLRQDVVVDRH